MSTEQPFFSTDTPLLRGAPKRPTVHTVHVRFSPAQGPRLRRRTPAPVDPYWTERPMLMERVDGSYDLIGTTTSLDTLVQWILSHGPNAEVQGPAELRRRIRAEARGIARLYAEENGSHTH